MTLLLHGWFENEDHLHVYGMNYDEIVCVFDMTGHSQYIKYPYTCFSSLLR